jgi:hypothetical protein
MCAAVLAPACSATTLPLDRRFDPTVLTRSDTCLPGAVNPSDIYFIPALLEYCLRAELLAGNHVLMQRLRLFLLELTGAVGQRTPHKFSSYHALLEQFTALHSLSPAALHIVTGQGLSGSRAIRTRHLCSLSACL